MKAVKLVSVSSVAIVIAVLLLLAGAAFAQRATDPGVQAASRGTGAAVPSVQGDTPAGILSFFNDGLARFQSVESVSNSPNGNNGLGPRFNFNQCAGCHAVPAVGGSAPAVNAQFAGVGSCGSVGGLSQTATRVGAGQPAAAQTGTIACNNTNTIPNFITANGPMREVRFPFFFNAAGRANTAAPNGGVEDIFTVSGRPDGGQNCSLQQPSFAAAEAANNIIFRIPTPTFGAGLIENLDDSTLLVNRINNLDNQFGIAGTFNHNGNDGTISRFGWKAQNKSLHIFAGEAYNVEMGISNELFTQDRPLPGEDQMGTGLPASCLNLTGTGYPEDTSNPTNAPAVASRVLDDVSAFANFMRYLAAPQAGGVMLKGQPVSAANIAAGQALFGAIGCATCHNPIPGTTQTSNFTSSLGNAPVPAFSDIEIHHMGARLADNVSQGGAGGDQFRTAPLWGVGQRIYLLHDGRTSNLLTAIQDHASRGSEANTVIENFDTLSQQQQQQVLDFVRSL
jgi:CxxC motif-containing protein (DUF1111 family)